jgi:2-aminobenzoate-CoA ligase
LIDLAPTAHVDTFTRDGLPPAASWPELRFDLAELRYPQRLNCAGPLLDTWVERGLGERRCLITDAGAWTYAELERRAAQVARVLVEDHGLVPGNRVLLRGPNNPWLVAAWFGVMKAGGVAVVTMPLLRPGELRTVAEMARVDLAACDHRFLADLETAGIPGLRVVPYGSGRAGDLLAAAAGKPDAFQNVETSADDVCILAFTSGTTGRPKATMHFHRDVLAIADTFSRHVLRPLADDVFTGSPPLAFTFGLGVELVFPLRVGAATLLLEQATPDRLLEAVARHRVTVLSTAPTAYRAMVGGAGAADLSSLRRCVSAGETLPRATWEAFHEATGIAIIDGIGSTEMLHIFVSSADADIRPGKTGRAVPGYVAEVQDEAGRPVPDGEIGLLAVKGPTGCRYLYGDRQGSYVRRGWNITGDLYTRDAEGYFEYVSRADDMIISAGYNISGAEVEQALLLHPAVAETAVVGIPDEERGMLVKAFVVPRPGVDAGAALVRELQDFVKSQIAPYKYPRALELVDALPRTSTGKVQRYVLRDSGR